MTPRALVLASLLLVAAAAEAQQIGPPSMASDVPAVQGETPRPYEEGDAHGRVAEAVRASARDHRTVLVVFGGNWCVWCRRLDFELTHDPVLSPIVRDHFRVVHVDSRSNRPLDQEWGHPTGHGVPVIVVLDAAGQPTFTQDTGLLELGEGHSRTRVEAFLRRFLPAS
jgi:thioredoxin-related protein